MLCRPLAMNYGGGVSASGSTVVAPSQEEVWRIEDQFLFGDDFLVAPVFAPGQSGVLVYFPANSGTWVHLVSEFSEAERCCVAVLQYCSICTAE